MHEALRGLALVARQIALLPVAQTGVSMDHFLIDDAPSGSVPDHAMKRELTVHGMGWGHLPDFLIDDDLKTGRLVRVGGRHLPGKMETLTASRLRDRAHGPVAERLWEHVRAHVL